MPICPSTPAMGVSEPNHTANRPRSIHRPVAPSTGLSVSDRSLSCREQVQTDLPHGWACVASCSRGAYNHGKVEMERAYRAPLWELPHLAWGALCASRERRPAIGEGSGHPAQSLRSLACVAPSALREEGVVKLVHISAYYKADQPDGLNGSLASPDGSDLTAMLQELRASWDELWRSAVDGQTTDDLVRALELQLAEIGARRQQQGSSSEKDLLIAIANIDLLERVGRLKGNEFNGVMLIHAEKSRAVVVPQSSPGGSASAPEDET